MRTSRRAFLGTLAASGVVCLHAREAAAAQGLDAFGGALLPCASDNVATPPVARSAHYRPGAPLRRSVLEPGLPGVRLTLTGIVAGLSCGPIAGATIEFWQADHLGNYDQTGFRLRGRQVTDNAGRYQLVTVMPGASGGDAPNIGVHVAVAGKAELWTAVFFRGEPRNARDPRVQDSLLATLSGPRDARTATFDIRLDL
jgi:protocatechuate 3,4-dioxygenase beta subunit